MSAHQCPKCHYTTNRKYNMIRHIETVHKTEKSDGHFCATDGHFCAKNGHFCASDGHFCAADGHFCAKNHETVSNINGNRENRHVCDKCEKTFTTAKSLKRHSQHNCKQVKLQFTCDKCQEKFASKKTLSAHTRYNRCRIVTDDQVGTPCNSAPVHVETQNIETQNINITNNNITNNNITNNNTVNVLVFPNDIDQDFDFDISHIQDSLMKKYITQSKPQVGFEMFMGKVLKHPANRIAHKTNPNTKYSKVHVGDGKYEYATDAKVMPIVTHHMTTAALQKVNDMKPKPIYAGIRQKASEFIKFIDEVNTNDEGKEYMEALDTIKLILVNIFLRDK